MYYPAHKFKFTIHKYYFFNIPDARIANRTYGKREKTLNSVQGKHFTTLRHVELHLLLVCVIEEHGKGGFSS